jgi:hypothetical protein
MMHKKTSWAVMSHKGGGSDMVSKPNESTSSEKSGQTPFFELGKEQTEAMLGMQKELAQAYEQASRDWLARVKSEVDLWTELAAKMAATRSVPEALRAYQVCVAQRVQMAADDGQRLADDCQRIMEKVSRSVSFNGRPTAST